MVDSTIPVVTPLPDRNPPFVPMFCSQPEIKPPSPCPVAVVSFPRNIPPMSNAQTSFHRDGLERRHNPRLRELVDEMLASIRATANVDLWSPEERDHCEAHLARIMKTVRTHAVNGGTCGPPDERVTA
jgi:hypothetical protein